MNIRELIAAVSAYHPNPDIGLLERAYEFAKKAHEGQTRHSGEPFFAHLYETALLTCQIKLDVPSVAAALLHDTIEDSYVSREDLAREFGVEIADIVEGVTKLSRTEFDSREVKQAESFRKMLLAMARDIRVVLVKLCDRLHNMRTLEHHNEDGQRRIALETQEIYAPLANRLGLHWLKSELEDRCLLFLRPAIYKLIDENFRKNHAQREQYIERTTKILSEKLVESGVSALVKGRAKHYASVWQKMEAQNLSFEEIYDLIGFRIIVPTVRACYETLGIVHSCWKPVPNRFKDYIAMPKPNMYQSLHTTLIGPEGLRIEIQIRTPEMHRVAEEGIAAHWRYKDGSNVNFDLSWVRNLVETQEYLKNPDEFIQSVKSELFPEEVFIFTPKGSLIRLPTGATSVDFAYAVHTDIGNHTVGAKVNGAIVPLSYELENGDTVEILTSKNSRPSKDWLNYVRSSKARQRIRAFLRTQERERALTVGHELLFKDAKRVKAGLKGLEKDGKLLEAAEKLGFKDLDELYVQIGYGKLHTGKVLAIIFPDETPPEEPITPKPSQLERIFQRAAKASRDRVGVRVSGQGDIVVRFARCCEPLPGDRIVGFITRGRGVAVHYAECQQVLTMDPARRVDVEWDMDITLERNVCLAVHSQDQRGVLGNVSQRIADHGANILRAEAKTDSYGKAVSIFEIQITDARQLDKILRSIEMVPGVIKVVRERSTVSQSRSLLKPTFRNKVRQRAQEKRGRRSGN